MNTPTVPPDPPLHVGDLRWIVPPIDRLEDRDVLMLDEPELVTHVADLRLELRWVRRLLHEALACVASLTMRLQRAMTTIAELRRQANPRRPA